jgi:hypothetical protein
LEFGVGVGLCVCCWCMKWRLSLVSSIRRLALGQYYFAKNFVNLPKAGEAITEITLNYLESWIYPSKTQRGISLSELTWYGIGQMLG